MEILFFLKLKENQKFKEKKKTSKGKVENKSSGPTFWAPKIKRRKNKKLKQDRLRPVTRWLLAGFTVSIEALHDIHSSSLPHGHPHSTTRVIFVT